MLQQNSKRFYKGLYVTFKLAPNLKKNTLYFLSYSPLNEGHVSILKYCRINKKREKSTLSASIHVIFS